MGIKYLWDTNIVIYYLQNAFPQASAKFIDELLKEQQPIFSFITEIELLSWKTDNDQDRELIKKFISNSLVLDADHSIKIKAAEIRRLYSTKLPDALIASAALTYDLTLLTRNTKDFDKIKDLKVLDVWEIKSL